MDFITAEVTSCKVKFLELLRSKEASSVSLESGSSSALCVHAGLEVCLHGTVFVAKKRWGCTSEAENGEAGGVQGGEVLSCIPPCV